MKSRDVRVAVALLGRRWNQVMAGRASLQHWKVERRKIKVKKD